MARATGIEVPECTLAESMRDARLVIIAVPVQAIAEVAAVAMSAAPPDAAIIHCGGVQSRAALKLDEPTYARVLVRIRSQARTTPDSAPRARICFADPP